MKTSCDYNRELLKKIVPKMSYCGKDYDKWKTEARKKLSELLGLDNFVKVADEIDIEYEMKLDNATEIRFTFKTEEGYRAPAHMFLPQNIDNPPVMICLQGHSKGMHISFGRPKYPGDEKSINSGDRDFCVKALKEGFAAIALEQRALGECGFNDGSNMCLQSAMTALIQGRTTIGERVWDIMRLIDVIEKYFSNKVDVNKICLMGNSGGGTATAYASALEDRIILAMPSSALCTFKDSIGAMFHCSCNYIPDIANYFEMSDLISMAYPKFYIQVNGIDDPIFPIKGAEEVFEKGKIIYEQNNFSDKCVLVKGNGPHRFYADDAWPLVHELLKI